MTLITVTINPVVHVNRLIILKHFIISFCLLNHYITTFCCCQVVFLMIVFYKPYQLKHLNFHTYLFTHHAFTEIANCTSGRTTTTISSDADSMKFVTYIWLNRTWTCNSLAFLQSVFPLTPSANIISVFIHLTIIYMVTDMKIIIYFIKVWFCCSLFYILVHIPTSSNVITSFNHQKLLFF